MHSIASARRAGVLLLLGTGVACGQSTLPAISPTAAPRAGHPAQVVYSRGMLEIDADNSSLNQILRDVSRETGMKITGGLADERVYGKYGPSPPAEVLASLLNGTSSNMLLRETASYAPAELILTPRHGGPTPPDPNAPGFDDAAAAGEPAGTALSRQQAPMASPVPPPMARPAINPSGRPFYSNILSAPATPSTLMGASGSTDTPSADTSNPQSPNGVKTPQQIYQQLQQLQLQIGRASC